MAARATIVKRILRGLGLAALAAAALAADLWTKAWAERALSSPRAVIDGVFVFARAHNPYGAASLLRGTPDAVRMPLLVGLSVVAMTAIVVMAARSAPQTLTRRAAFALLLAGALGNLIDRVRHGYVVDFIELQARWAGAVHRWPTFNVADVAIVAGVALLLLEPRALRARRLGNVGNAGNV